MQPRACEAISGNIFAVTTEAQAATGAECVEAGDTFYNARDNPYNTELSSPKCQRYQDGQTILAAPSLRPLYPD